ncbi:hypothetical protein HELRODRAFT_170685 [Helobdella robusta]|uniref:EF-hand domain-containing protein n=1 Tax=Helobdella robusta TaxID=6412 RepID=T1F3B4_HELRO|nr:hypothetical protein HELRODRAFT_170685 [Helobdella robusta]ESO07352.1 hypothetical protein HELRODRAFT_170685 [Helobdella robusta]
MGNDQGKPNFKELSKGTKFSTKELSDWHKKFKKDFPDGKINKQQFITLYQKMFGDDKAASTEFCEHVFKRYDTDNNGVVDFKEFITTLSVASRGTNEEKLMWAFKLYDKDNNGRTSQSLMILSLANFFYLAIYKSRNVANPSQKAKDTARSILNKADDNRDNRLSEAEFIMHVKDCPEIKDMLHGF